jgi:hypothetical protein
MSGDAKKSQARTVQKAAVFCETEPIFRGLRGARNKIAECDQCGATKQVKIC